VRHTPVTTRSVRKAPLATRLSVCALFAVCLALVGSFARSRGVVPVAPVAAAQDKCQDYSAYQHDCPKHKTLGCAECHQRARDNSIQPYYNGRASLPGHAACQECHLPQFVQVNAPMCYICHDNVENSSHPPEKNFPGLKSFNVQFDHAQHDTGTARPPDRCAACHTPAGRRAGAMSIPATLRAHEQCYKCHTPDAPHAANGHDIAVCSACHLIGNYARTPAAGRSFAVGFSHQQHGRNKGLNCSDCHNLRAGAPQRQQVSSTRPLQHFGSGQAQSCMTCHNDQRKFNGKVVFGDKDFNKCASCHKSTTFRM
jgi:Cytochrome c7 and related cytochrome c